MAARGKHILIADDYPDAIDIWAIFLRAFGYQVSTASDGAEALSRAEHELPDLIVLDLEMPGISGFEAARRLRQSPSTHDIPLIAATGYSHHRQLSLARDAGFDRVMVKPIDPDSLLEEIEKLLDRYASVRQPSRSAMESAHDNG